jgi:hypothetical protein
MSSEIENLGEILVRISVKMDSVSDRMAVFNSWMVCIILERFVIQVLQPKIVARVGVLSG